MVLLLGFLTFFLATHGTYAVKGGPGIIQEQAHIALDEASRPYTFSYEAPRPYVQSVRQEDPFGRVRGAYAVSDPLGGDKVVQYTADERGVHADVQSTDPRRPGAAHIVSVPGQGTVATVQEAVDPISQAHDPGLSAFGGPGAIQFTLGDPATGKGFVPRIRDPLYRIGLSRVPYGLSGLDYYSYPASLYAPRRRVKTVVTKGGPAGLQGIGALGAGSPSIQYAVGDPLTGRTYIARRPLYRTGQSLIPYGLSGLDYYSYPAGLYSPRRVKTVVTKTSPGGVAGLGGIGALAARKGAAAGLGGPGAIQFALGDPAAAKGFISRRPLYRNGQSLIPYGLSGLDYYSYPSYLAPRRGVKTVVTSGAGGLTGIGGLGAGGAPSIQFALGDPAAGLGGLAGTKGGLGRSYRPLYNIGRSRLPFGLLGHDYYSYPSDLSFGLPRYLSKANLAGARRSPFAGSDVQQGIADVGFGGGSPSVVDYTIGDPVTGGVQRIRKIVYRNGQSAIPYGLSGFDYYSYPNTLLNRLARKGFSKASGGVTSPFARPVQGVVEESVVDPVTGDVVQKRITKTVAPAGAGGLTGPGAVQFTLGDQQSKIGSGFGPLYTIRRSSVPYGLTGLDYYSYPARLYRQRLANAARAALLRNVQERLADSALGGGSDPFEQQRVLGGGAPGNIHFTLGVASGVAGGLKRAYLDPVSASLQRPVVAKTIASPAVAAGVPNIQFALGDQALGGIGAPAVVKKVTTVSKPVVDPVLAAAGLAAPEPVVVKEVTTVQKPAADVFGQRKIAAGGLGGGPGNIQFTLGDSALAGPAVVAPQVAYLDTGLGGGPLRKTQKTIVRTQDLSPTRPRLGSGAGPVIEFSLGDSRPFAASPVAPLVAARPAVISAGAGPNIQFTLGDSQILGAPQVATITSDPRITQEQIVVPAAGTGDPVADAVADALSGGAGGVGAGPAQIVQQEIVGAGAGDPTAQLALEDPAASLPGGDLLRTRVVQQEQLGGPGSGGPTVTKVIDTVQEPVGLGSGDFGAAAPRVFTYVPRMSYLVQPRYDIPYSSLGGRGTYGLRTSALGAPVTQQKVEQFLVKK